MAVPALLCLNKWEEDGNTSRSVSGELGEQTDEGHSSVCPPSTSYSTQHSHVSLWAASVWIGGVLFLENCLIVFKFHFYAIVIFL